MDDIKGTTQEATTREEKQDVQVSSANPPHTNQVSQWDSMLIKDVLDTSKKNVNPLTKEDLKKILIEYTIKTQLCTHPVLVRVEKIEKVELASIREKPQETSNVPPQSKK